MHLEQGRFTWSHNTVLKFLAQKLLSLKPLKLHANLPGYFSSCILTGKNLHPDMLLTTVEKCLYLTELTVGFATNLDKNARRKEIKYHSLLKNFTISYCKVNVYTNHSSSSTFSRNIYIEKIFDVIKFFSCNLQKPAECLDRSFS